MEDFPTWIQSGAFGLLVAILMGAGWFVVHHIWPFVKEQLKESQLYMREQATKAEQSHQECERNILQMSREFSDTMKKQTAASQEIVKEFRRAIDKIPNPKRNNPQ